MDAKTKQQQKIALASKLAEQRIEFSSSRNALTRELSASHLLKRSLRENPIPWFSGIFGIATVTSFLFRKSLGPRKRRGPIGLLFGLSLTLVKPALIKWGVDFAKIRIAEYLDDQVKQSTNSKLGGRY